MVLLAFLAVKDNAPVYSYKTKTFEGIDLETLSAMYTVIHNLHFFNLKGDSVNFLDSDNYFTFFRRKSIFCKEENSEVFAVGIYERNNRMLKESSNSMDVLFENFLLYYNKCIKGDYNGAVDMGAKARLDNIINYVNKSLSLKKDRKE